MKIFLFLLQNLPSILQAILGIEATVNAPGATKKAMVMNSLAIAAKVGESIPESHVAAVSAMVDSVVGSLNSSGVFTHKTASSTTSAPASGLMAALKPPVSS
jgi:hypothetical protein